jgi:CelD/BcsL family acetyltransferase involved in cellulose biosynthesis
MNEAQTAELAGYRRSRPKPVQLGARTPAESRSRACPGLLIGIHADLAGVERVWRNLEAATPATVFQNFDYLHAWFRHIGAREGVTPAVVVLRTADTVLALLPFAVSKGRLLRRLTWLGQDLCDYLAPLATPAFSQIDAERFRVLWREIRAQLQAHPRFRHDWIEFRRMPRKIGATPNPFAMLPVTRHASDAHVARLGAPWAKYYQARRTAKARKQDRSKLARLKEFGDVDLVSPAEPAAIARTIDQLIEQKRDMFKRRGIADLFRRPGVREFFVDLATGPRTSSFVHVSALSAGPSLAAIALGTEYGGRYSLFLVSYDHSFARLSPGVIHLGMMIERAIGRGLSEFDFLVGEQRLKLEWADETVELYDHITASTLRGYLVALAVRGLAYLKRRIKQTPQLWSAFRMLRQAAGAVRGRRPPD